MMPEVTRLSARGGKKIQAGKEIARKSQGFLKAIFKRSWRRRASMGSGHAKEAFMTAEIKTRPDGSIDIAHYTGIGRRMRSEQAMSILTCGAERKMRPRRKRPGLFRLA